jgi:hypothetical protein
LPISSDYLARSVHSLPAKIDARFGDKLFFHQLIFKSDLARLGQLMAGPSMIREKLDKARKELLDLSARNSLVHTPLDKVRAKCIGIVNEISQQVFQNPVRDSRTISFLPAPNSDTSEGNEQDDTFGSLPPAADTQDANAAFERHTDTRLQTTLASDTLQKRLLKVYYDARTYEEEQGINILYLACGFLEWYESPASEKARWSPLILIPVRLERQNVGSRFKLTHLDEEIATNLSIQAKLDAEFGVRLPDLPPADDLEPERYYSEVAAAIADRPKWKVLPNAIILGFFSFAKFLMYRDLDPDTWKGELSPENHPSVIGLMEGGLASGVPFCGDDEPIDPFISPAEMVHIVDCDSSQAVAVEEVRRGRSLVIQGPPGTGKSQTIANIVATAVKEGKKVLFVAEKMAALEVVKRRLDNAGLGSMCLELHSNKANKRNVVQELGRTLELGQPKAQQLNTVVENLRRNRDRLNEYVSAMHEPLQPAGLTPYQVIGELVRLQRQGVSSPTIQMDGALTWTPAQYEERLTLIEDALLHVKQIGNPREHTWRGVMLPAILPMDRQRLTEQVRDTIKLFDQATATAARLVKELHVQLANSTLNSWLQIVRLGERLTDAPAVDRQSLGNSIWESRRKEISAIVGQGKQLAANQAKLSSIVLEAAWTVDLAPVRHSLTGTVVRFCAGSVEITDKQPDN